MQESNYTLASGIKKFNNNRINKISLCKGYSIYDLSNDSMALFPAVKKICGLYDKSKPICTITGGAICNEYTLSDYKYIKMNKSIKQHGKI